MGLFLHGIARVWVLAMARAFSQRSLVGARSRILSAQSALWWPRWGESTEEHFTGREHHLTPLCVIACRRPVALLGPSTSFPQPGRQGSPWRRCPVVRSVRRQVRAGRARQRRGWRTSLCTWRLRMDLDSQGYTYRRGPIGKGYKRYLAIGLHRSGVTPGRFQGRYISAPRRQSGCRARHRCSPRAQSATAG